MRLPKAFYLLLGVGSFTLLFISIYPGLLRDIFWGTFFIIAVLFIPIMLLVFAFVYIFYKKKWYSRFKVSKSDTRLFLLIVVPTIFLYISLIPMRISFFISQDHFIEKMEEIKSDSDFEFKNQSIGFYSVDEIRVVEDGGVYFRTLQGGDGLGPDIRSSGFAFKPDLNTPFGSANLFLRKLYGEWYVFSVSDDY